MAVLKRNLKHQYTWTRFDAFAHTICTHNSRVSTWSPSHSPRTAQDATCSPPLHQPAGSLGRARSIPETLLSTNFFFPASPTPGSSPAILHTGQGGSSEVQYDQVTPQPGDLCCTPHPACPLSSGDGATKLLASMTNRLLPWRTQTRPTHAYLRRPLQTPGSHALFPACPLGK